MPGPLSESAFARARRRSGLALLLCGAGIGVALLASDPEPEKPALERQRFALLDAKLPAAVAPRALPAAEALFRPEAGRRYVYAFERRIAIRGLGEENPEISYHGELRIDVLRAGPRDFQAIAQATIAEQPGLSALALLVEMDASGKSFAVRSRADAGREPDSAEQKAILKDLLVHWDFPLEEDTVGPFRASFGSKGLFKEKLAYLGERRGLPEILKSRHSMEWDAERGMPARVSGVESTRLGAPGASPASAPTSESSYDLKLERVERIDPALHGARADGFSRGEGLSVLADADASGLGSPDGSSRGPTWAEVSRRLAGIADLSSREQLELFGDLLKSLRSNPDGVGALVSLLGSDAIAQGPDSPLYKTLVGALATLGTPEAQRALVDLYRDSATPAGGKGLILSALTTTPAPVDGPTRDFLAATLKGEGDPDLADGAAYALGSSLQAASAPGGRPSSVERAIAALLELWEAAVRSGDPARKRVALDAMGNSGRNEFFAVVRGVILASGDADPGLRAKAVFALRFMRLPAARELLVALLSGDSAPASRLAAARAMQHAGWDEAFRAPLSRCAGSEAASEVRRACEETLGQSPRTLASSG